MDELHTTLCEALVLLHAIQEAGDLPDVKSTTVEVVLDDTITALGDYLRVNLPKEGDTNV